MGNDFNGNAGLVLGAVSGAAAVGGGLCVVAVVKTKEKQPIPNPGSPEAIKRGCKCPVLDNGHGKGNHMDENGKPLFWYSRECGLHWINP